MYHKRQQRVDEDPVETFRWKFGIGRDSANDGFAASGGLAPARAAIALPRDPRSSGKKLLSNGGFLGRASRPTGAAVEVARPTVRAITE
jgi:hypothetical protein